MPTLSEGGTYYIRRNLPHIGPVRRSLGTKSKEHAQDLERMLVKFGEDGKFRLLEAWHHRRKGADIEELYAAKESQQLPQLEARLAQPDFPPLSAAISDALKMREADVRASTLERYSEGLAHFFDFVSNKPSSDKKDALPLGDISVDEALTEDMVRLFKLHRKKAGAAEQTINKDLQAVSVLVTRAMKKKWIAERPTKDVGRFEYVKEPVYLEPEQVDLYLAFTRARFRAQFELMLSAGLRLGETERVTRDDFRNGWVRVRGERVYVEGKPKTSAGIRRVPIGWCADTIEKHIEQHGLGRYDRLFVSSGSFKYPKRRTVQKEHDRACGLAGIVGYTLHNHRDTWAGDLAEAGIPLGTLQKLCGHKHITTTMIYASRHPDYNTVDKFFKSVATKLGRSHVRVYDRPHEEAETEDGE